MSVTILAGDCRALLPTLPAASVQCVVTSPPYWGLRDYGVEDQLGLEPTPEAYLKSMVAVFREVRRVLRDDGTLWLNMGDSYANTGPGSWGSSDKSTLTTGSRNGAWAPGKTVGTVPARDLGTLKPKDLVGMPWRLAFALQADGWYLRADIIWAKPNPMPESVTDRPTKAHEYVFLLTKSARYFFDADAVREPHMSPKAFREDWSPVHASMRPNNGARSMRDFPPGDTTMGFSEGGRNLRSVWTIPSHPYPDAHFATFPPALASRCIQAGTSAKGCCAACGAPWERQIQSGVGVAYDGSPRMTGRPDGAERRNLRGGQREWNSYQPPVTTGWAPVCICDTLTTNCNGPPVPCTVLDPFGGSGTVGEVAEQLGRHSILIELSPAYVTLARARTAQRGLFAQDAAS